MTTEVKKGPGRPKGSLNKLLMNNTRIYQEEAALHPDDFREAYRFITGVMRDEDYDVKVRMEAYDRFVKWCIYMPSTVSTATMVQEVSEKRTPEELESLKAALLAKAVG